MAETKTHGAGECQITPLFPDRHSPEHRAEAASLTPEAVEAYLAAHGLRATINLRDDVPLRKVLEVMGRGKL